MKRFILFPIIFFSINTFSQDLIVLNKNDTIFCKITYTQTDGLNYRKKSEDTVRYIHAEEYKEYKIYYEKYRYGISIGWGYKPNSIINYPSGLESYQNKLKQGINLGLDFNYSTDIVRSFGIKYNLFACKNSIDNYKYIDSVGNTIKIGLVKNNIQIHYIGPTLMTRFPLFKRRFLIEVSCGVLFYKEKAIVLNPLLITGKTFGMNINVQYEIPITEKYTIGFIVGNQLGTLKNIKYDYGNYSERKKEKYSLMRFDITLAFKYRK